MRHWRVLACVRASVADSFLMQEVTEPVASITIILLLGVIMCKVGSFALALAMPVYSITSAELVGAIAATVSTFS